MALRCLSTNAFRVEKPLIEKTNYELEEIEISCFWLHESLVLFCTKHWGKLFKNASIYLLAMDVSERILLRRGNAILRSKTIFLKYLKTLPFLINVMHSHRSSLTHSFRKRILPYRLECNPGVLFLFQDFGRDQFKEYYNLMI